MSWVRPMPAEEYIAPGLEIKYRPTPEQKWRARGMAIGEGYEGTSQFLVGEEFERQRAEEQGTLLSRDEVMERATAAGVVLDAGIGELTSTAEANLLIERQSKRQMREQALADAEIGGIERFALNVLGGIPDPVNLIGGFGGMALRGSVLLGKGVAKAAAKKTVGRALAVGAVEGVAGTAVAEPLYYGLSRRSGIDYGVADSFANILIGGMLGSGLHATGHVIGTALERRRVVPAQLAAMMEDRDIDIEPLLDTAPTRLARATEEEVHAIQLMRAAKDDPSLAPAAKEFFDALSPKMQARVTHAVETEILAPGTTGPVAPTMREIELEIRADGAARELDASLDRALADERPETLAAVARDMFPPADPKVPIEIPAGANAKAVNAFMAKLDKHGWGDKSRAAFDKLTTDDKTAVRALLADHGKAPKTDEEMEVARDMFGVREPGAPAERPPARLTHAADEVLTALKRGGDDPKAVEAFSKLSRVEQEGVRRGLHIARRVAAARTKPSLQPMERAPEREVLRQFAGEPPVPKHELDALDTIKKSPAYKPKALEPVEPGDADPELVAMEKRLADRREEVKLARDELGDAPPDAAVRAIDEELARISPVERALKSLVVCMRG